MALPEILSNILGGDKLVDAIGKIIDNVVTTKGEKEQLNIELKKLIIEHTEKAEEQAIELYQAEVNDRASARQREAAVAQTGKFDFMHYLTGIVGLASFAFIIYALVYLAIPQANKELFIHLIGIVEGVTISIFAYYFGSSRSSQKKDETISDIMKNNQ